MRVARLTRHGINLIVVLGFLAIVWYFTSDSIKSKHDFGERDMERIEKRQRQMKEESHIFYDLVQEENKIDVGLDPKVVPVVVEEEPTETEVVVLVVAQDGMGFDLFEDEEENKKGVEMLEAPVELEQKKMEDVDLLRDEDVLIGDKVIDRSDDLEADVHDFEGIANAAHMGMADFVEPHKTFNNSIYYSVEDLLPLYKKPTSEVTAAGEFGRPFELPARVQSALRHKITEGFNKHGLNVIVSDLISPHRNLGDRRPKECRIKYFKKPLPTVSIIVCFYDEVLSVLLRTIYSILESTPGILFEELILVDDNSHLENLGEELEKEISEIPEVKLVRANERLGVIKTRMMAASNATGDVLVFLDSHCEVYEGWLEPLLERIALDPTKIVTPVLEIINPDNFQYLVTPMHQVPRGGFDWTLTFRWIDPPKERYIDPTLDMTQPIITPAISGGAYAIDKNYFYELGAYDEEMDVWGGEGLELSFRAWMCGGGLEIVPCSHVGHVFKPTPVNYPDEYIYKNKRRVADIWLDDYKQIFYKRLPCARTENPGNMTARENLRNDLNCKSFEWYLENVYPQLYVPELNPARSGAICCMFSPIAFLCLDTKNLMGISGKSVHMDIHKKLRDSQYFELTKTGELRQPAARDVCVTAVNTRIDMQQCAFPVLTEEEPPKEQQWEIDNTGRIKSSWNGLCLTADPNGIWLDVCRSTNDIRQQWKWRENLS